MSRCMPLHCCAFRINSESPNNSHQLSTFWSHDPWNNSNEKKTLSPKWWSHRVLTRPTFLIDHAISQGQHVIRIYLWFLVEPWEICRTNMNGRILWLQDMNWSQAAHKSVYWTCWCFKCLNIARAGWLHTIVVEAVFCCRGYVSNRRLIGEHRKNTYHVRSSLVGYTGLLYHPSNVGIAIISHPPHHHKWVV